MAVYKKERLEPSSLLQRLKKITANPRRLECFEMVSSAASRLLPIDVARERSRSNQPMNLITSTAAIDSSAPIRAVKTNALVTSTNAYKENQQRQ